jgi:DNA mismatch repair protein MutL
VDTTGDVMTTKIRTLSEQTINQIAAGEVIENPASVVKELVENAVDAGGSRIAVEVTGGGHQLIRVSDNGSGMGREDALLCLQRHATSKIEKADDLIALVTMGFRGEALASIASISKMRVVTAEEGATGTEVEVEGGRVVHVGDISRVCGTTVEVRALFYNVPARKKFQKAPAPSVAEIVKVVTQQALAHPEIGFDLIAQDQTVFSVQALAYQEFVEGVCERSSHLLGGHFQTDVFKMDLKQEGCRLKGVIGSPLAHRHNRTGQYLFINRRPVVCPLIAYAIRDAYGTRLPSDRHPIFSLHLEVPSDRVDVNVHPQKKEVRLRDERGLRQSIQTAVDLALQHAESPPVFRQDVDEKLFFCEEARSPLFCAEDLPEALFREEDLSSVEEEELPLETSAFRLIGLFSHYLMVHYGADLVLVDLQAAHARILFDRLVKSSEATAVRQGLLIPEVLAVSAEEEMLLHAYEEEMAKIGFDLRECGKNKFIIDAVPPFIESDQVLDAVRHILTELGGQRSGTEERLRRLAQATCRFARGRKKGFMLQEAEEIFKQLMQSSSPAFCPHGNLTMFQMSQDEIEKKFSSTNR